MIERARERERERGSGEEARENIDRIYGVNYGEFLINNPHTRLFLLTIYYKERNFILRVNR